MSTKPLQLHHSYVALSENGMVQTHWRLMLMVPQLLAGHYAVQAHWRLVLMVPQLLA